jgi:hypothetical protein
MDLTEFRKSLTTGTPPPGLGIALRALWHDANGEWDRAHELAQQQEDQAGAWVHAYLHRKQGDLTNASYWYRHAQKATPNTTLEVEWEALVKALLSN